jgi:hypothetical protein
MAKIFQKRALAQKLQLHRLVPAAKSTSHSNLIAAQWQLPVYDFFIAVLRPRVE